VLVYRPSDGFFALWYGQATVGPDFNYQAGRLTIADAQLIPGDFNGDGRTDVLVYRPSDGFFALWYGPVTVGPDFVYQPGRLTIDDAQLITRPQ
jgi:hypothetical protein